MKTNNKIDELQQHNEHQKQCTWGYNPTSHVGKTTPPMCTSNPMQHPR